MEWEDFYEILGVSSDATKEQIKEAYRYKAFTLHPDRMVGLPDTVKRRAEEDFKKVNRAHEVLSDPQTRKTYDQDWARKRTGAPRPPVPKPIPVADPPSIVLRDMAPGETRRGSFMVRNTGGPYTSFITRLVQPDPWVKVLGHAPLPNSSGSPVKVEIEVKAGGLGKSYVQYVGIRLDTEETQVRIELHMKPQLVKEKLPVVHVTDMQPQKVKCPRCSYVNDKYEGEHLRIYCGKCLRALDPHEKQCEKCKRSMPATAEFCPSCGYKQN